MNAQQIKQKATELGADRCGIASIDRFANAPEGFSPLDVYKKAKSVVVFLVQLPPEILFAENLVPYTRIMFDVIFPRLDSIAFDLCRFFAQNGVNAVPVPADSPYLSFDPETKHGNGLISMRHAAVNAGLGILGRSNLFLSKELGNTASICAVLVDEDLEADPLVTDFACVPGCRKCIDSCPSHALGGESTVQLNCREAFSLTTARGFTVYQCSKCRMVCPLCRGQRAIRQGETGA